MTLWRWALVLLALARSALAAEPLHLALVLANSAYQNLPALPACQASGSVVTAALRRAGWSVTELRDPSNGQMSAGIAQFADRLAKTPDAAALVYACGYAAAFENRLFLLPATARLVRETDALTEGVVLPALTGVMSRAGVQAGLVAVDLVALPGKPPVPTDGVARRNPGPRTGLLLASAAGGPDGPTPTADSLATALAEPNLSVGRAQSIIMGDGAPARGAHGYIEPPAEEGWLAGSPPPETQAVVLPMPTAPTAPTVPRSPAEPLAPTSPPPTTTPSTSGAPAPLGDLDRRRVQLALQRLGYYAGKVDGTFGPESLAAIRRYQHELGGEMNGRLTEEQATRLYAPQ